MNLEQTPPNKPNFLLIVLIAAGAILVIFLIALAAVGWDGRRLMPHTFTKPTSTQMVLPGGGTGPRLG